jgi:hypothetical protein
VKNLEAKYVIHGLDEINESVDAGLYALFIGIFAVSISGEVISQSSKLL